MKIRHQADTGNRNFAFVEMETGNKYLNIPDIYLPVLALAGVDIIAADKMNARDWEGTLNSGIEQLLNSRNTFVEGLTVTQLTYRETVIQLLERWRTICVSHPNTVIYLFP